VKLSGELYMKILALEFSSLQRSVAVLDPETDSIAEAVDTAGGRTMRPLALIDSALKQARLEREEIDAVAVGLGPGSYTGIRAAIALAQGWQLARGVKICGISSALCLASQAAAKGLAQFNVVIDAQRGEFYLATYETMEGGELRSLSPLRIVAHETITEREHAGEVVSGPEVTKWFPNGHQLFPCAATLAQLASTSPDFVPGEKLEPIYLRETTFVKATAGHSASS